MFFKESKYRCSVSQTADWDNFYAVRPRVCKLAAGNDHQQIRFPKICFAGNICSPHKLLDLKKVLRSFFNFAAAKLELNQRIPAIRQVKYAVRFQIGTVVIVAVSFFLLSVYHVSRRYGSFHCPLLGVQFNAQSGSRFGSGDVQTQYFVRR